MSLASIGMLLADPADALIIAGFAAVVCRAGDKIIAVTLGAGSVLNCVAYALQAQWMWSALSGATAVLLLESWWRKRKDRKRALDAIGAKSRARLAALVRTMKERSSPRPVLRPAPGGAS